MTYTTETVPINAIWQGGEIHPAVIIKDDGKYIEYIMLGGRDVRGAWIKEPTLRHAPKANDRGANRRQDQPFRAAFHSCLQHAVNLLNGATP